MRADGTERLRVSGLPADTHAVGQTTKATQRVGRQPSPEEMADGIADQRVGVEPLRGDQLGLQEPFGGSRFLSADVCECPSRIGVEAANMTTSPARHTATTARTPARTGRTPTRVCCQPLTNGVTTTSTPRCTSRPYRSSFRR